MLSGFILYYFKKEHLSHKKFYNVYYSELMLSFDFKLMFRLAYKSLFAAKGTHARLTPKRIGILLLLAPTFVLVELVTWMGFLLDEIFFRKYRTIEIKQPVFIIGVPRSGTTFLQRLLAQDEDQFTSMKFWEILLAPLGGEKFVGFAGGLGCTIPRNSSAPMSKSDPSPRVSQVTASYGRTSPSKS